MRGWALAAVVVSVSGVGCYGPCDRLESAAKRCGSSFNRSSCDKNISACSQDDVKTIDNSADCLENDAVCKAGNVENAGKAFSCILPEASVSDACAKALENT